MHTRNPFQRHPSYEILLVPTPYLLPSLCTFGSEVFGNEQIEARIRFSSSEAVPD